MYIRQTNAPKCRLQTTLLILEGQSLHIDRLVAFIHKDSFNAGGYPSLLDCLVGILFDLSCQSLVVAITVVVVILQKEVLVRAVCSKGDSSDAEAGEQALEAVEAAEGTGIAPSLTGKC